MSYDNGKIDGQDDPHEARAARLFSRYDRSKVDKFQKWLATPHGKKVYEYFVRFSREWYEAGHERCGATLLANRVRWEMSTGEQFTGWKIPNNYIPMMGRQLAVDDPVFANGFFVFHGVKDEAGVATA